MSSAVFLVLSTWKSWNLCKPNKKPPPDRAAAFFYNKLQFALSLLSENTQKTDCNLMLNAVYFTLKSYAYHARRKIL